MMESNLGGKGIFDFHILSYNALRLEHKLSQKPEHGTDPGTMDKCCLCTSFFPSGTVNKAKNLQLNRSLDSVLGENQLLLFCSIK